MIRILYSELSLVTLADGDDHLREFGVRSDKLSVPLRWKGLENSKNIMWYTRVWFDPRLHSPDVPKARETLEMDRKAIMIKQWIFYILFNVSWNTVYLCVKRLAAEDSWFPRVSHVLSEFFYDFMKNICPSWIWW